jgi:hypothetical protein
LQVLDFRHMVEEPAASACMIDIKMDNHYASHVS